VGRAPPGDGVQALQKQVSRLRRRLGPAAPLSRGASGYALGIDHDAVDAHRFERLLQHARDALADNRADSARDDLEAALALWRGPALADHRFEPFAQLEIRRLEELRMEAIEERIAAELSRGRDADLVGELRGLVSENPLRERLRGHLMLALGDTGAGGVTCGAGVGVGLGVGVGVGGGGAATVNATSVLRPTFGGCASSACSAVTV
jgi:DNA-binding SARP family transcriptional activator